MVPSHPFITVDQVTIRLGDASILENSFWKIRADEHWAVLGPNGSGKTTLVRSLWGGAPLRKGRILYEFAGQGSYARVVPPREAIGYVSFELHQGLMEQEEGQQEFREYAGKKDEGTTVREVVFSGILATRALAMEDEQKFREVAKLLRIEDLLPRPITSLSTGEMRKTLIARALMKTPQLLILDEPFDGLDERARQALAESVNQLMTGPMRCILVAHRIEEIVPNITHALFVKEGRIFMQGPKDKILTSENLSQLYGCPLQLGKNNGSYFLSYGPEREEKIEMPRGCKDVLFEETGILIEMKNTTVRYGDHIVLDNLNWMMRPGENWAILGPNGSGKSTVVKLILGDNLQGYANQITLFGKRKGSGETLWDIKKKIGAVSSEFQVQYRKKMDAQDVIASGFYDSIGLYQYPTPEQKAIVDRWVALLGIEDIAQQPYHHLSYGQKRMILLARAMVKNPLLLVVDEPCHGLDVSNRRRILRILEKIGETQTHLLFITNHREEVLDCITHVMRLRKGRVVQQGKKEEVLGK